MAVDGAGSATREQQCAERTRECPAQCRCRHRIPVRPTIVDSGSLTRSGATRRGYGDVEPGGGSAHARPRRQRPYRPPRCVTPVSGRGRSAGCACPPTATPCGSRAATRSHGAFAERVRRVAAALAARGVGGRRPGGVVRRQPSRRPRDAVRVRAARRDLGAGERAAGRARGGVRAEHSGTSLLVHGARHRAACAGARGTAPGRRLAVETPGADSYEDAVAAADAGRAGRAGGPRRPVPDHVHVRHDRAAEGRGADPRQHDVERGQPVARLRLRRRRAHARPRAAVPHRRPERHRQPDPAARRLRGARPPLRPGRRRSRSSSSSGSPRSSPCRRCSTRWRASPASRPATSRPCARSAPPVRRCRSPPCRPGSSAV